MRSTLLITGVVLCVLAAPAWAALSGTVHSTFNGVSGNTYVVYGDGLGSGGLNVYVGQSNFTKLGSTGDGNYIPGPTFPAFCVDLQDALAPYTDTWNIADVDLVPDGGYGPMGAVKAGRIAELWAEHYSPTMDNNNRAAFQLAVWEIIYQNVSAVSEYDVTGGATYSSGWTGFSAPTAAGTVGNLANGWLHTLDGSGWAWLGGMTLGTNQDFITRLVPVPGAALLGLLGLSLVGWVKRRLA